MLPKNALSGVGEWQHSLFTRVSLPRAIQVWKAAILKLKIKDFSHIHVHKHHLHNWIDIENSTAMVLIRGAVEPLDDAENSRCAVIFLTWPVFYSCS